MIISNELIERIQKEFMKLINVTGSVTPTVIIETLNALKEPDKIPFGQPKPKFKVGDFLRLDKGNTDNYSFATVVSFEYEAFDIGDTVQEWVYKMDNHGKWAESACKLLKRKRISTEKVLEILEQVEEKHKSQCIVKNPDGKIWYTSNYMNYPVLCDKNTNPSSIGFRFITPEEAFKVGAIVQWKSDKFKIEGEISKIRPDGDVIIDIGVDILDFGIKALTLIEPAP